MGIRSTALNWIRSRRRSTVTFGGVEIELPRGHLLPLYMQEHPQYDRFLPKLASLLPIGSVVVDVGANCGDTLAAMWESAPKLSYVCIEADEEFFASLQRNISKIRKVDRDLTVSAIQALVGTGKTGMLSGVGGTKKLIEQSNGASASISLDDILSTQGNSGLDLLKIDTDGYDHDVIMCALPVIERYRPMIFFEAYEESKAQLLAYVQAIGELVKHGYSTWAVFDNFGGLILKAGSSEDVVDILYYVHEQNDNKATRTIQYPDICAARPEHMALLDAATKL